LKIAGLATRLVTASASPSRNMPVFFQVIVKVDILKGDILNVKYVTGHVLHPAPKYEPGKAGREQAAW
jgi:hypothetical protein